MNRSSQWLLWCTLFFVSTTATIARAEINEKRHIHHFFNARLLNPGENQVSIAGNYKLGINEHVEIGTQGLLILMGALNVSIKHKMFERPDWTTAFVFHGFRIESEQPRELSTSSDDEDESTATDTGTTRALFYAAAAGIITTYELDYGSYLNYGIYDYMLRQSVDALHQVMSLHVFSLCVGYDRYLTNDLALTATVAYPVWLMGQVESDVTDVEINFNLATGLPPKLNPSLAFLTLTKSMETLNLEGGFMFVGAQPALYGNVFWRFY